MKKNSKNKILNITLIGFFAALCYIALMLFFIPFAGMFIHFGNLIVVVAALLIGGVNGGIAGSIGMGLFDLFNGHADSVPKTVILKFLIGLTVGIIFKIFNKEKRDNAKAMTISGLIFIMISVILSLYSIFGGNNFSGNIKILAPIFFIIGGVAIFFAIINKKLPVRTSAAVIAAILGMCVNIAGELLWKTVQFTLAGSAFSAAFTASLLSQGSTLINAGISVIGGVILYLSLEKPFKHILSK